MFAAMAGEAGCRSNEIAAMAAALPGRADLLSRGDPTHAIWLDESGAFAAACRAVALLPEDPLDTQPFVDLELIFVCRARLDDRAGLLQLLQIDTARGAAMSDAQILRQCYKKWREDTPRYVYGDFTFVAWERWSRRTVAATDHLGNIPLFYCRAGGRILFATQLGALLACPAVRANLDPDALGLMAAGRPAQGRTMFAGINLLPGGQLLVHHDELLRIEQWWRPDTAPRDVHSHPRDYVDEARALFDSAVASRLRARGGVIATMSGGLDSTLVAVTAARQMSASGKVLEALTAIPQEDVAWATAVADFQPNIRQRMVSSAGMTPIDILPIAHGLAHSPVGDPANLVRMWQTTSHAAHSRARVILCADHGNQSISYAGDLCDANFIRLRRIAGAAQQTWDRVRCIGARPPGNNTTVPAGQWIERSTQSIVEGSPASERAAFVRAMTTPHAPARVDFVAQFGVEWLDPTADRKLLERLLTFPLHIFRVGNRPRGLARELGRGRLPESVRLRRSRGCHIPRETTWFTQRADDYRRAFQSLRESSICAAFLDFPTLEPLLTALCAGGGSPTQAMTVHRALDAGLFAAALEAAQGLGSATRHGRDRASGQAEDMGGEPAQHARDVSSPHNPVCIPTLRVFGSGEVDSTRGRTATAQQPV
jgi:asparagine synthase (glutamine-hydrolysing)